MAADDKVTVTDGAGVVYDGEGKCLDCGYSLRQLTAVQCPECGRGFDPGDEQTMWMGRVPGVTGRFMLKPVGWPLFGLAVLAAMMSIYADMLPGDDMVFKVLSPFGWIVVGGIWLARVIMFIVAEQMFYQFKNSPVRPSIRWLVGPLIFLLTVVLTWTDLPEQVAFWVSRPAMERLAAEVMEANMHTHAPFSSRWVGVYYARDIEKTADGVQFAVSVDMFTTTGFCYSLNNRPRKYDWGGNPFMPFLPAQYRYIHLHDEWYIWTK